MNISCKVLDIFDYFILVEYMSEVDNMLNRRYIPRELADDIHKKGPANLSDDVIAAGIEYSNVLLEDTLGEQFETVRIRDLQAAMRLAGLWTREDYKSNPDTVNRVVREIRGTVKKLDLATVMNAALRPMEV